MPTIIAIAPRIGSGTDTDPYRPKIHGTGVTKYSSIEYRGSNLFLCLMEVTQDALDALDLDADLAFIPIDKLGVQVGNISAATRNRIAARLEAHGIPTDWIDATTYVREIVSFFKGLAFASQRMKGQKESAAFEFLTHNIDADLSTIPAARLNGIKVWAGKNGIPADKYSGTTKVREVLTDLGMRESRVCRIQFAGMAL
ncbi:MAG: hypothetical protein M1377_06080 [Deltaproteobacteria bacterium]|nr:hypothetical protein [Deltaproteobacteria bacterium]